MPVLADAPAVNTRSFTLSNVWFGRLGDPIRRTPRPRQRRPLRAVMGVGLERFRKAFGDDLSDEELQEVRTDLYEIAAVAVEVYVERSSKGQTLKKPR